MIEISLIVGLILSALAAAREYVLRSPIIIIYISFISIFYLPVGYEYACDRQYVDRVYLTAILFADFYVLSLAVMMTLLRSILATNDAWYSLYDPGNKNSSDGLYLPAFVSFASLAGFFVSLRLFSWSAVMSLDWWDVVQSGSSAVVVSTYLAYASAGMLVIAWQFRTKKTLFRTSVALTFFWMLFAVLVLKTRSYILIPLIPVVTYAFLKRGFSQKISSFLALSLATSLFVLARAVRHAGSLDNLNRSDLGALVVGASQGSETTLYKAFLFFVNYGNNFPGFNENATLLRVLLFWLPSSVSDAKPPEFSYTMHDAYFGITSHRGLSLHPTAFGDAFGNAGAFGVVIYPAVLALLFVIVERSAKSSHNLTYKASAFSILAVSCVTFARGATYNAFMFTVIPIVIIVVLRATTRVGAILR